MSGISRRGLLVGAAAGVVACKAGGASTPGATASEAASTRGQETNMEKAPALFISHGSPMAALDQDDYTDALLTFGQSVRPQAIVVVSAHWETRDGVRVTGQQNPPLVYDFGGFPDALYRLTYPSPGQPALASRVVELLRGAGVNAVLDTTRGWDHGTWVPLRLTFPAAEIPIVQVSLPRPRTPQDVVRMGQALAPLRREGVLLFGSGGVVHNLRVFDWDKDAPVQGWAQAFDAWAAERIASRDVGALADWRHAAPNGTLAVPTTEHYDPLFFTLGAGADGERVSDVYVGIKNGTMSLRSFALGV